MADKYKPMQAAEVAQWDAEVGVLEVTLTDGDNAGAKAKLPSLPLEFDHQRAGLYRDLPASGQDAESILCEIGIKAAEYCELRSHNIVG